MTEFNLSEKMTWTGERLVLDPRHVKEFIKRERKIDKSIKQRIKKIKDCKVRNCVHCQADWKEIIRLYEKKRKLAGEKLV